MVRRRFILMRVHGKLSFPAHLSRFQLSLGGFHRGKAETYFGGVCCTQRNHRVAEYCFWGVVIGRLAKHGRWCTASTMFNVCEAGIWNTVVILTSYCTTFVSYPACSLNMNEFPGKSHSGSSRIQYWYGPYIMKNYAELRGAEYVMRFIMTYSAAYIYIS